VLKHAEMRKLSLGLATLAVGVSTLLGDGGAWRPHQRYTTQTHSLVDSIMESISSLARIRTVFSRWIFIMAARLHIRWAISCSTVRSRLTHGIAGHYLKSV